MNRVKLFLLVMVVLALIFGVPVGAQDVPDVTPEATEAVIVVEATPEATVVVVETPPVDEPAPSEPFFKFSDLLILGAMVLLGFSHPPQTGKLFGDIMKRVQDGITQSPNKTDDMILAIMTPTLEQIQARLNAVDAALKTAIPQEAVTTPKLE